MVAKQNVERIQHNQPTFGTKTYRNGQFPSIAKGHQGQRLFHTLNEPSAAQARVVRLRGFENVVHLDWSIVSRKSDRNQFTNVRLEAVSLFENFVADTI